MAVIAKVRNYLARYVVFNAVRLWHTKIYGMHIGEGTRISRGAKLDRTCPDGLHIGEYCMITSGVKILTHDFVQRKRAVTRVGSNCFIGYDSIIMPGITIGDNCIIGAGSVVTKDIPSNSVAVGSPARIVESDAKISRFGIRLDRGNDTPVAL